MGFFLGVFIAVKRQYDHGNSYNRKHLICDWLTISEVGSYSYGGKRGSVQADMLEE